MCVCVRATLKPDPPTSEEEKGAAIKGASYRGVRVCARKIAHEVQRGRMSAVELDPLTEILCTREGGHTIDDRRRQLKLQLQKFL